MKIRMIHKFEGKKISAVAFELGFVVSTVKDAACIKEHFKGKEMIN
jgi:hypothetical protein